VAKGWNGSSAGYYPVFSIDGTGLANFKCDLTIGDATATASVALNGNNATGSGSIISYKAGGTLLMAMGNRSAISGGSFDNTFCFYFNSGSALCPYTDGSYSLGNTTYRWGNIYAVDIQVRAASQPTLSFYESNTSSTWQIFNTGGNLQITKAGVANVIQMSTSWIVPNNDNSIALGGSSNRWSTIYAVTGNYSGDITASGNVSAYSDIRFKDNIINITDAISKIKQIRGVTFTRTDTKDPNHRFVGVIAQELQKVLPEAVTEDTNGVLTVAYGNIAGLFVEAHKETDDRVSKLEKENAELKAQIRAMMARLNKLEEIR
jgi:hypothetical protein